MIIEGDESDRIRQEVMHKEGMGEYIRPIYPDNCMVQGQGRYNFTPGSDTHGEKPMKSLEEITRVAALLHQKAEDIRKQEEYDQQASLFLKEELDKMLDPEFVKMLAGQGSAEPIGVLDMRTSEFKKEEHGPAIPERDPLQRLSCNLGSCCEGYG